LLATLASWLVPSFADVVYMALIVILVLAGSRIISADGDPARHIVVGRHILSTGSIPSTNVFSTSVPEAPFHPHEWLAEVASAISYDWLGAAGPALLHGVVIALAFTVLFRHLRARGHRLTSSLALTFTAAAVSSLHWIARPHIFTFLGTAMVMALLDAFRAGRIRARILWLLQLITAVWANFHGGYLLGLVLIATYVAADLVRVCLGDAGKAASARSRLKMLLAVFAGCIVSVGFTPGGPLGLLRLFAYVRGSAITDNTSEFLSPNFHLASDQLFLLFLLSLIAALAFSSRRPALEEGAAVVGLVAMALHSARYIPLAVIALTPLFARQLETVRIRGAQNALTRLARIVAAWGQRRDEAWTRIDQTLRG